MTVKITMEPPITRETGQAVKLFEAAPELLARLEECVDVIESIAIEGCRMRKGEIRAIVKDARKAIKAAS